MSRQVPPETIDVGHLTEQRVHISGLRDVEPNLSSQTRRETNFSDGSGPLFNMYIKMTEEEDKKMAHRWQKDADGILIFTGLFSAALAALVAVSVQDLKPNPQDTSAFYLANIYKLLANPNISRELILATPAQPPPFSPPKSAIWVNSLWFLSLVISLTCALLATLLQQWARRYVTITQPQRYSPHKRAPIREFFANGVERFHLPWSVEALPALLHLSLFLFFCGLAVFLFNIDHTVFSVVIWWVRLAGGLYGCITFMPVFWHDSPYYAPLSSSALFFYSGIQYAVSRVVDFLWDHNYTFLPRVWSGEYRERLFGGMTKTIQETGSKLSAEICHRILTWTMEALDEDKELEQFFEAIPSFCGSYRVSNPKSIFSRVDSDDATLGLTFLEFTCRTLHSKLISEADKLRRIMTCVKAADTAQLCHASLLTLWGVFELGVDVVLRSVEFGRSLRSGDEDPGLCAQGIIAGIISSVPKRERDDRWVALAKYQLGVSKKVFQHYLAHGDSVLLANFIHITRPLFRLRLEVIFDSSENLSPLLSQISKFNVQNTLPELQHDFCALWNEITQEARDCDLSIDDEEISSYILRPIRHLYVALHQGTDAAPTAFNASTGDDDSILCQSSSYPLCNVPDHHSDRRTAGKATHTLTTISAPANPPSAILNIVTPPSKPVVSSESFPASSSNQRRVHFSDQLSLRDLPDAMPTAEPFPHTPPVNVASSSFTTTSLDLIKQVPPDTPLTVSPTSDSESDPHVPTVSTFALDPPFAPPPSRTTDPDNNANFGIVSDSPLSSSSAPVASDTPAANTQSSSASLAYQIDQPTAPPEPSSTSAAAISLMPPQGTSVSHSSTTPNDDDDRPPAPDLPHNVEAPGRSLEYETAMSGPDIVIDVSRHALDIASFSREIDHPE